MTALLTLLTGLVRGMLAYKLVKILIVFPIVFAFTQFIQEQIVSIVSGIVIPSDLYPFLMYFYIDKAIAIFLSFFQMRGYLKMLDLYLKTI